MASDVSVGKIAGELGVSRETAGRLAIYVAELRRWQRVTNLVGPATLADVWQRHIADCLQMASLVDASVWADLGSGAGLPGLVLAIADPGKTVHLIESDGRKCAFLREMVRLTGATARVWDARIDTVVDRLDPAPTVITARALAPLTSLIDMAQSLLRTGAIALFPKGRGYATELTHARESWRFDVDILPSCTDGSARILRVTNFRGRQASGAE